MTDRTWALMQKHLDSGCYYMVSSQDAAPSESALRAIAKSFGCEFPDEFIAHSTNKYGGLYVEVNEDIWPRHKAYDVGPFWSFLYGLFTFNASAGIPPFMDLTSNAAEFAEETSLKVVPFMKIIGDADVYCFDRDGKIVRWNHEENELDRVEHSFFELLEYELAQLAERKDRKVSGTDAPST